MTIDASLKSWLRRRQGSSLCVLAFLCQLAVAQELPSGWRKANARESSGEWRQKSSSKFLRAIGDFDGDGKPDIAELLVEMSGKRWALFVRLTSAGKWQMLDAPSDIESLDRFGVAVAKPGRYETACGKGYGDYACGHGEPDVLNLTRPGIDFFYTESSDSIFYWDRSAKAFHKHLISD
jgi:hypothetical protein